MCKSGCNSGSCAGFAYAFLVEAGLQGAAGAIINAQLANSSYKMHAHLESTSLSSSRTEPSTRWQMLLVFLFKPSLFLTMLQKYVQYFGLMKSTVLGLACVVVWGLDVQKQVSKEPQTLQESQCFKVLLHFEVL